jgi:hypothetical protein
MTRECWEVYARPVGAVSWERGYRRNWLKWAIFSRLLESGKIGGRTGERGCRGSRLDMQLLWAQLQYSTDGLCVFLRSA